ncbi:MAG: D-amino acid aminotransferase [Gemmatimonadaceae bacterium]
MIVYLNGSYVPSEDAQLSALDRGFIFGDGVYEVWRAVNGRLFEAERHRERLERGLRDLRIGPPDGADADGLRTIAEQLLRENDLLDGHATFYVQVTRGTAPRTHQFPPAGTRPTVFAYAAPLKSLEQERRNGVRAITQPDVRWLRCNIKTVQLLPNVLAKQAAVEAGAFEAIFVRDGIAMEGTHSNLFAVLNGELRTHPTNHLILPGVTRDVVLELARELGIPWREQPVTEAELRWVEELFFTGTTTDVLPVVNVDDFEIGDGKPGPIAGALYEGLVGRMEAVGAGV